jgi:hypothetical protein
MKTIRQFCATSTLLIVLSVSAVAGDITTGATSPPPPPPSSATATATEPSHIGTDVTESATESETLLTKITLSLLQLLSVI